MKHRIDTPIRESIQVLFCIVKQSKGGDKMSALMEKLKAKEQAKEQSQGRQIWKPAEGEILEGVVTEHATTITPFGEAEYCDIKEDDGKVWTIYPNKILAAQFEAEFVQKGTRVLIKFMGLKNSKKGSRRYKDYLVIVDDITVPPDAGEDNVVDVDEVIEE